MTTRERAVEVDEALAALYDDLWKARDRLTQTFQSIHYTVRDRQLTRTRWAMTDDGAVAVLTARVHDPATPAWHQRDGLRLLAEVERWVAAIEAADEAIRPLSAEYHADPWPRFFLVQNHGGHIHSSMHCSTCHPTTRYGWLPSLSGLTEDDAVREQGPILCSVCYPSAPVEWTMGLPKAPRCEGSGKRPAPGRERYASQPCSVCGRYYPVSLNTGLIRAHKPQEA